MEAVKKERSENIDISPEWSSVSESESDGRIERAIRTIQGQARIMKMALESRFQERVDETHNILP